MQVTLRKLMSEIHDSWNFENCCLVFKRAHKVTQFLNCAKKKSFVKTFQSYSGTQREKHNTNENAASGFISRQTSVWQRSHIAVEISTFCCSQKKVVFVVWFLRFWLASGNLMESLKEFTWCQASTILSVATLLLSTIWKTHPVSLWDSGKRSKRFIQFKCIKTAVIVELFGCRGIFTLKCPLCTIQEMWRYWPWQ